MSGEQTIRRGVRNARYAAIPNHVFEDDRLSMEARWLLGYLLSKPDNWTVVIGDIVKRGKCGRDKARKMIAELVEVGYADREQTREDGKFSSSVLVIYDEPTAREGERNQIASESVAFLPQTDLPATAKPSPDSPAPVKSALSNNSVLAITDDSNQRESASERDGQEEENPKTIIRKFDKWWPTYPGYAGTSREAALKEWIAMSRQEREDCIARTPAFIKATQAVKGSFVWPSVYLRERKWLLMDEPTSAVATPTVHNPFSRAWMALRLAELTKPMRREGWPALSQWQVAQSRDPDRAQQINRERMARYGWPKVTEMHEKADRRVGMLVHGPLVGISEGFVKMHRDSEEAAAWKAMHERMGWPWFAEPTPDWLWMPEGKPEAAMKDLQAKLNEATGRGMSDDAA